MGANYPAEFGRSQGSVLNVIFKSGTNQLHGSAYEFLRNSPLDSNDFFANQKGQPLGSFKRSQFGGTVSGPIRRDKTFFMISYEGLRARTYDSTTTTSADGPAAGRAISRRRSPPAGRSITILRSVQHPRQRLGIRPRSFPGQQDSGRAIRPGRRKRPEVLSGGRTLAGNTVTNANNYYNAGPHLTDIDQPDVRVDHNITRPAEVLRPLLVPPHAGRSARACFRRASGHRRRPRQPGKPRARRGSRLHQHALARPPSSTRGWASRARCSSTPTRASASCRRAWDCRSRWTPRWTAPMFPGVTASGLRQPGRQRPPP